MRIAEKLISRIKFIFFSGFQAADSRAGQTMVFLIMILIILAFVVLWNVDLHNVLYLKSRTQNAGDAAALASARWQGITLNLVGDLNIMQAIVLSAGDTNSSMQISELQARLCYAGPVIGFLAAQQAAKNNGIYANALFSVYLSEHANAIREDYPEIFPEPYTNCWEEYSQMLDAVASEGVAAGADNAHFYRDYAGSHTLLTLDFYDAVASRDWCWFYWNNSTLLYSYTDYHYWPDLPPIIAQPHPTDSEIFGLGLSPLNSTLPGGTATVSRLNLLADERGISEAIISNTVAEIPAVWRIYNPSIWTDWTAISLTGDERFPAAAEVKAQYNYAGADSAVRIESGIERLTPGSEQSVITWTAAAKPFGYIMADGVPVKPNEYSLVIPAFHNVRLIPVDTSSAPEGGSYNLEWRRHIEEHLPLYMENGPEALDESCWYCQQLGKWENPDFRQDGIDWLTATNEFGELSHPCAIYGGPGGPGGGTRRGH